MSIELSNIFEKHINDNSMKMHIELSEQIRNRTKDEKNIWSGRMKK